MDGPPIREGAVVIDATDAVVDLGPRAAVRGRHGGLPEARADGVLLPGLVNAHTHLELSALAGRVPGGGGVVAWTRRLLEAAPAVAAETRRRAAADAAVAAVDAGTAAIGDVANALDAAPPAIAAAGLRGVLFHEILGSRDARTGDALADAAREFDAASADWPRGLGYVPAPHAPYSAGPDLLRRIFTAARRAKMPTSIHLAEDADEIALLVSGGGGWPALLAALGVEAGSRTPRKRPAAYLADLGAFDTPAPPLLVHMVEADAEDRAAAAAAGATAVLCPRSNRHVTGRRADVPALLRDGLPIAIGTDSLASAPDLSLWGEIAALAQDHPAVPPATWLVAATQAGAHAMRLHALGAIRPGGRPGVIDVSVGDLDRPLAALVREPRPVVRWVAKA